MQKIFQKMNFEKFQIEDVKSYLISAFKQVPTFDQFLQCFKKEQESLHETIRQFVVAQLRKLPRRQDKFEYGLNQKQYTKVANRIIDINQYVDSVYYELDKVFKIYAKNFCKLTPSKQQFSDFYSQKDVLLRQIFVDNFLAFKFIEHSFGYLMQSGSGNEVLERVLQKLMDLQERPYVKVALGIKLQEPRFQDLVKYKEEIMQQFYDENEVLFSGKGKKKKKKKKKSAKKQTLEKSLSPGEAEGELDNALEEVRQQFDFGGKLEYRFGEEFIREVETRLLKFT